MESSEQIQEYSKIYLPLGDEKDGLKLELTFNGEVLDGKVLFPIVGQALVEGGVFLSGDVLGVTSPQRLGLVELLILSCLLLDLLGLLLLFLLLVFDFLDLGFLTLGLFLNFLVILNFLQLWSTLVQRNRRNWNEPSQPLW